jgi:MFS transporter, OPA family, solute carrier family 37 (glycerol-3-phosphate transporter), member 1/2
VANSCGQGNAKALGIVTAIIDGTGSIGAAVGPFLTGLISSEGTWDDVFWMLIASAGIAAIMLSRLVTKELKGLCGRSPY